MSVSNTKEHLRTTRIHQTHLFFSLLFFSVSMPPFGGKNLFNDLHVNSYIYIKLDTLYVYIEMMILPHWQNTKIICFSRHIICSSFLCYSNNAHFLKQDEQHPLEWLSWHYWVPHWYSKRLSHFLHPAWYATVETRIPYAKSKMLSRSSSFWWFCQLLGSIQAAKKKKHGKIVTTVCIGDFWIEGRFHSIIINCTGQNR